MPSLSYILVLLLAQIFTATAHTEFHFPSKPWQNSRPNRPIARSSALRWKNETTTSSDSASCSEVEPGQRSAAAKNIFQAIDGSEPPFPIVNTHVTASVGLSAKNGPRQTNKFYTNLFLDSQRSPVYLHPYVIAWTGCNLAGACHQGVAIWHTELEDVKFGNGNPAPYYYSPTHLQQIVLCAKELSSGSVLSTENANAMSIGMTLTAKGSSKIVMKLPLVQGMGFVTAKYFNSTPEVGTLVGFSDFKLLENSPLQGSKKYSMNSTDGSQWVMYLVPADPTSQIDFQKKDDMTYVFSSGRFTGLIQVAKLSRDNPKSLDIYDNAAGIYAVDASIKGTTSGSSGEYQIAWKTSGLKNRNLLMFALPHHVESMQKGQKAKLVDLSLRTTTKGMATGVLGSEIIFVEKSLPSNINFAPWSAATEKSRTCVKSPAILKYIAGMSKLEIAAWPNSRLAGEDSVYWSGKYIASFARLVQASIYLGDPETTAAGLQKLMTAVSKRMADGRSRNLVYEKVWGGIINSWGNKLGQERNDYGNALYNDHHFHYGYWVYSAAVIASMNPTWLQEGRNRAWVNALVRDFANPVQDSHFPFSRNFDWYHGHSWASGLDVSVDGKNEESSSEDVFAMYAVKLWGQVTGDTAMEARANLQLAILKRSLRNYFLIDSDNVNHPPNFIDNKAVGILFENKAHHTTYFGENIELIQGIHMLPISPISAYTRSQKFVLGEWQQFFNDTNFSPKFKDWTATLRGNQALIDPRSSYDFFSAENFNSGYLLDGESRAYYLIFSALLAGL